MKPHTVENSTGSIADWFDARSAPTAEQLRGCMGTLVCPTCGRWHGYCSEVNEQLTGIKGDSGRTSPGEETAMDLKGQYDPKQKRASFEKRDWLNGEDLTSKPVKAKIDGVRENKSSKAKGVIAYVDLTIGKKKYTWSLRKGFTLNAACDLLGTNTDKWTGKFIKLVAGGSEGQYVNVAE